MLALLLYSLLSRPLSADTGGCTFQKRDLREAAFSALPKEIVGWMNCRPIAGVRLNLIYVALLDPQVDPLVWLKEYADVVVPATLGTRVRERSKEWNVIDSLREYGSVTHFLFHVGDREHEKIIFVYTDTSERAGHLRAQIESLRSSFARPEILAPIVRLK